MPKVKLEDIQAQANQNKFKDNDYVLLVCTIVKAVKINKSMQKAIFIVKKRNNSLYYVIAYGLMYKKIMALDYGSKIIIEGHLESRLQNNVIYTYININTLELYTTQKKIESEEIYEIINSIDNIDATNFLSNLNANKRK